MSKIMKQVSATSSEWGAGAGRFASPGDIAVDDSFVYVRPQPPARHCGRCCRRMSQYNTDDCCFACQEYKMQQRMQLGDRRRYPKIEAMLQVRRRSLVCP